jgi:hypothetical protein
MLKKSLLLSMFSLMINVGQALPSSIKGEMYDEGTNAQFHPIGFSDDKRVFAFEVYGEIAEYGSFSEIYILDTEKNILVTGRPIGTEEAELDIERPLFQVRLDTWKKAAPLIAQYQADKGYTKILAYNPATEINDKSNILKYRMEGFSNEFYELQLKPKEFPGNAACSGVPLGFSLQMNAPVEQIIYQDKSLPDGRTCVLRYELVAVIGNYSATPMIAMIRSTSDIHDESWIAIPFPEVPER